jgi:adenylate kinase family enzyme
MSEPLFSKDASESDEVALCKLSTIYQRSSTFLYCLRCSLSFKSSVRTSSAMGGLHRSEFRYAGQVPARQFCRALYPAQPLVHNHHVAVDSAAELWLLTAWLECAVLRAGRCLAKFQDCKSIEHGWKLEPMKILVFGNSGSGKSTYAQHLAQTHALAHLDLDSIVWEPDQIAVPRAPELIALSLQAFIATHPAWVIEGCYGELVEAASLHCDQLVFLNPGLDACIAHNLMRPWEPHKYASLEQQNSMLANLQAWVAGYYQRGDSWSYRAHRQIFEDFSGAKIEHCERISHGS